MIRSEKHLAWKLGKHAGLDPERLTIRWGTGRLPRLWIEAQGRLKDREIELVFEWAEPVLWCDMPQLGRRADAVVLYHEGRTVIRRRPGDERVSPFRVNVSQAPALRIVGSAEDMQDAADGRPVGITLGDADEDGTVEVKLGGCPEARVPIEGPTRGQWAMRSAEELLGKTLCCRAQGALYVVEEVGLLTDRSPEDPGAWVVWYSPTKATREMFPGIGDEADSLTHGLSASLLDVSSLSRIVTEATQPGACLADEDHPLVTAESVRVPGPVGQKTTVAWADEVEAWLKQVGSVLAQGD